MTCPQCGGENPAGKKFCGECGASLAASEELNADSQTTSANLAPRADTLDHHDPHRPRRLDQTRTRRVGVVSRILLATLLPAFLVVQVAVVREYRTHGPWWFPFSVTGAQGSSGYPLVNRLHAPNLPLHVGDSVLRIGGVDLRGLSRSEVMHATAFLLGRRQPIPVELQRDGASLEATLEPVSDPYWWGLLAAVASLALCATFLLLRAPHWHLANRYFAAALLWGIVRTADLGQTQPALSLTHALALPLSMAFWLWCVFEWTEAARPLSRWQRVMPWATGIIAAASWAAHQLLILPTGLWPYRINVVNLNVFFAALVVGMARAYRRSGLLERRQLRWVFFGAAVSILPLVPLWVLPLLGLDVDWTHWDTVTGLFVIAIPAGIVVSVVGYGYLDIDRLISATASYMILAIAVVGGVLAAVPWLANVVSAAMGIDAEAGRIALSIGLAAVLVPAHRVLRPWVDRRLFSQHYALVRAFEQTLAELSTCRGVEDLVERAGDGIDALLQPDSIASYARAGEAFTPIFVRGRAAPPAFEAHSALVSALEVRGTVLAARAKELSPFERAALETLGAEVVMPVRARGALVAFTCLATKRSGDIYTPTDIALLAAVGERCSEVLSRLDASVVAEEARRVQSALRRYVPGAVAERLLEGGALVPVEQEVTVLFVDLCAYTQYTESRHVAEVFATLNEHTERVSAIVHGAGGTIVEFNGDGMMAVFGAPAALVDKERHAVEAARRIVDSMRRPLVVGVGIATGTAFVGSIRSSDRLIWTAVGNTVNLAARLQTLTRELSASIAVDAATRARAGYVCADFVRHADVAIRGRTGRFEIFALPARDDGNA
jgi:class 3 adenylate cyclase